MFNFFFFLNSALLGVGLAMDAFTVSIADGLAEPGMSKGKRFSIAGTFAFFQALMPILGWLAVHFIARQFNAFKIFIPYIALGLLLFLGIKMICEGIRNEKNESKISALDLKTLFIQGVATSIDALSVGFTISDYVFLGAFVAALIISAVTFVLCVVALFVGGKIGEKFSGKATFIGGVILILIGIEIFIKGIFGF